MRDDSWTCLMVQKGPGIVSDEIRSTLIMAACELSLRKWERMPVASDACDGIIETKWNAHSIGGRSGILFRTQVFCEQGDYFVNFLYSTGDLERGAEVLRQMDEDPTVPWGISSGKLPVPELYEFHELRIKPRRLH